MTTLKAIAVFIALGLSIAHTNQVIDPSLIPKFIVFSLLLLGIAIADLVNRRKDDISVKMLAEPINLAYAGYLLFNLISIVKVSVFSEWAFDMVKIALEFVFLLKLQALLRKHQGGTNLISLAVVVFGLIICLFGFIDICRFIQSHHTGKIDSAYVYLFTSTLANKNLFSSALFMTLPFCAITFARHSKKLIRFLSVITAFAALSFIIFLETRAVWVGITLASGITGIVFGWFFFRKRYYAGLSQRAMAGITISALLFILATGTFVYLHARNNPAFRARLTSTFGFSDFKENPTLNTYNLRYKLWTKSWQMFKDYPLTGVGAGNWEVHFPAYGIGDMEDETTKGIEHYQRPHNDFMWILTETGIGGLVCYAALFILPIVSLTRLINSTNTRRQLVFLYGLLFFFTGYGVISFFDFPKERVEHSVLFCVALSFVITAVVPLQENAKAKRLYRQALALPVAALALMVSSFRAYGEAHTLKVYAAQSVGNWTAMENEARTAQSIFYRLDPFSAPLYWYQGVAAYSKNNIDEAFNDFTRAYALHPNHVHVLNNLASCYVQKGDNNKAISLYKRAIAITPRFFESILNLSAVYFNMHEVDSAYNTIFKMPPDSTDERYRLFTTAIVKAKINSLFSAAKDPAVSTFANTLGANDQKALTVYMDARAKGIPLKTYIETAAAKSNP